MSDKPERERICISERIWVGYDLDDHGALIGTEHTENPETAARLLCAKKWVSSQSRRILVVGLEGAYVFAVSLSTEAVDP